MYMRCLHRSWECLRKMYWGVYLGCLRSYFVGLFILNKMCLGLVILASSLTATRRNVKGADINFYGDWHSKNISPAYKYPMEDWQYPQSILYSLSITHGVNHVSRYQSGTEATLQNHAGSWGDGRLWPASDFLGGSIWTRRIRAIDWQLCWGPECTCQLVITQQLLTVTLWAVCIT